MRFKGETVICDSCGAEINEDDDYAHPDNDEHFCHACASRQYNEWLKEPCKLCGKPMGDEPEGYFYNCNSESAHKSCIEKLSPEDLDADEWSDEYY